MKRSPDHPAVTPAQPRLVRCAIYTRKSTEEGLQQAFNTLDAQRESAEAYIASQKAEGWTCLPDRYDDGGFTGGNIERPAVKRLLADIEAGKIDCVVVYKVDRLSRSLLDFSRMMQVFEDHKVSFVSVTQHFNTTHSMGRLTLNILLSFAQFEREIISERTRDKIAAARRKGKFAGGRPVLGYDIQSNASGPKLVVNEDEAERVRKIFSLYLKHEGLIPTVTEINQRGWTTKRWPSSKGTTVGGIPFGKTTLFKLLTNVLYIGKVRYRDEVHAGEQPPIVDEKLWQRVQAKLKHNGRSGGCTVRNKHGALLKGLLRCTACDCSMGHSYTAKGSKRYRYYVCLNAQKRGWDACPAKSVPAAEIERFVIEQIRGIGKDPEMLEATIAQTKAQHEHAVDELTTERSALRRELARLSARLGKLAGQDDARSLRELADVQERIATADRRAAEIATELATLNATSIDEHDVRQALAASDPLWQTMAPREQARVIQLLVERVEYDGNAQTVAVTFRPGAMKALADQQQQHEVAA